MRLSTTSTRTALFLSLLVGLASTTAHAYIPRASTILGRMIRNHGKGLYIVDQEVQFRTSAEPLVLKEHWVVENGENMRLTVTAPQVTGRSSEPVRYDVIYRGGKRTVTDPVGGVKSVGISPEFLESFFHARSSQSLLSHLVRAQIVDASLLKEQPKVTKVEQIKYVPEPQIRLGRSSGVVSWVFGEPSPAEGKLNPSAWVEQDAFVLRRLRFPSEAEVSADRHTLYAGTLKFPRERTVTWADNSVTIRVVSVRTVTPAQASKAFDAAALNAVKNARLPDLAQVREFYTRFR